jgi:uncharacterized FlaG/YvyC family protein
MGLRKIYTDEELKERNKESKRRYEEKNREKRKIKREELKTAFKLVQELQKSVEAGGEYVLNKETLTDIADNFTEVPPVRAIGTRRVPIPIRIQV